MGTPISERPKEVKSRATFGHLELDSMVSGRAESRGFFATFVERKSRLYTAFKTPDRTAASMQTAITQLYNILPAGATSIVNRPFMFIRFFRYLFSCRQKAPRNLAISGHQNKQNYLISNSFSSSSALPPSARSPELMQNCPGPVLFPVQSRNRRSKRHLAVSENYLHSSD